MSTEPGQAPFYSTRGVWLEPQPVQPGGPRAGLIVGWAVLRGVSRVTHDWPGKSLGGHDGTPRAAARTHGMPTRTEWLTRRGVIDGRQGLP